MECSPFDPKITSGQPIPPVEHAISVSLPTWKDNLNYEDDKKNGSLARLYGDTLASSCTSVSGRCVSALLGSAGDLNG